MWSYYWCEKFKETINIKHLKQILIDLKKLVLGSHPIGYVDRDDGDDGGDGGGDFANSDS